jgi:hypothetical protein
MFYRDYLDFSSLEGLAVFSTQDRVQVSIPKISLNTLTRLTFKRSLVECLPSMCQTLSIPNTVKKKKIGEMQISFENSLLSQALEIFFAFEK